ncbi:MAG: N-acetylneuraminate synthase family protein [Treponema sp.]
MDLEFAVNGKVFSCRHPLIIAEIGTSHGGDIHKAFEMIDSAVWAGSDAVKFQIVYADEILHPNSGYVKLPEGDVLLYDRFKLLEKPSYFYAEIADYARKKGVMFSASVFGERSFQDLLALQPDFFKVASPELNYHALIKDIAKCNVPIILSTGVSRLSDIENAILAVRSITPNLPLAILHCITSYPAPESEYNILLIENLTNIFGVSVGLSDHSLHPFFIPALSLAFSSSVVEKHICLSRNEKGLDDKIALEPSDFKLMCETIRELEGKSKEEIIAYLIGKGIKEKSIFEAIGNGVKFLAPSELQNYERTNRSIHYLHDMKIGTSIRKEDICIVRTEKVLSVGISPQLYDVVLNSVLQRDVRAGEGVQLDDFIQKIN